ncbi:MAG: gliding motility-associated ABC transporter permease subunit GldF [Cytophagaceae bacterium]|nr:gliding motility-associated ABC transporter permease subunit GldF [Cytophagaceae bacterium]MDW8457223.1 gliding motility-associated ABC transporter permease subunit GldF [Cytophagaceae bacterium]
MISLYIKELSTYLYSFTAYVVMIVFVLFTGMFLWVFPDTNVLDYGYADMEIFFTYAAVAYMLLTPAITMRSFAEEKKDGTIEFLLTKPISDWHLLLGKYFAACTILAIALLPSLCFYFSIYTLGDPPGNIDSAAVFSSYIGLMLLAGVFASVGIFSSSVSNNQVLSFILSLAINYVLFDGFARLSSLGFLSSTSAFISQLGLDYHYLSLSKGLIDSRNVLYLISITCIMLVSTKLTLGSRNW